MARRAMPARHAHGAAPYPGFADQAGQRQQLAGVNPGLLDMLAKLQLALPEQLPAAAPEPAADGRAAERVLPAAPEGKHAAGQPVARRREHHRPAVAHFRDRVRRREHPAGDARADPVPAGAGAEGGLAGQGFLLPGSASGAPHDRPDVAHGLGAAARRRRSAVPGDAARRRPGRPRFGQRSRARLPKRWPNSKRASKPKRASPRPRSRRRSPPR